MNIYDEEAFLFLRPMYFDEAFGDLGMLIAKVKRMLTDAEVECDTFVGTGLSGSIIVPLLAKEFGKHFLIVRKGNDGSHSANPAEGRLGKHWLFVDDFVSSGRTRARVKEIVQNILFSHESLTGKKFETEYVGTLEYHGDGRVWTPQLEGEREAMLT